MEATSVERRLRERRSEMEERRAQLTRAPERGSSISFGKRVGDGTAEAVSRLSEVGVVDALNASIERVDRALAKLAEGSYGVCDTCGKAIPPKRLEVQPESAVCVSCARSPRARRPSA
jgi:DnaK suppressor protein